MMSSLNKSIIRLIVVFISILLIGCKLSYQEENEYFIQIDFDQQPIAKIATNTQAYIIWDTVDSLGGSFFYGIDENTLIHTVDFNESLELQNVVLSDLNPNTKYYYTFSFLIDNNNASTDTFYFWTTNVQSSITTDIETYQRQILSYLTGEISIGDSIVLNARGNSAERAIAANFLENEFIKMGFDANKHDFFSIDSSSKGTNVYCVIPATIDTESHIVIGAHYDTVNGSPGADDNGSGVALVLAVAREIIEMETRTKHTIVAFFDKEEVGLVGSRMFADSLYSAGTDIHSMHNADMVAWDSDQDFAVELARPDPFLEFLYKAANNETYNIPIHITGSGGSDHSSFIKLGYPAICVSEEYRNGDTTPHRHSSTDTFDTVNFDYLTNTTSFVAYAIKLLLSQ